MTEDRSTMTREQLLAAEIFGYSFANYDDHLGIGNVRFEQLMPAQVAILEQASGAAWPLAKTAAALETDEENARDLLDAYKRAAIVVDAENPAESFRNAVRFSIRDAAEKGALSDAAIEELVTQICFRAADLAYLLDRKGKPLSRYSRHLRRESDVSYSDGYFDDDDA